MPSAQSHREQAEYNEQAAASIRDTSPDWAVTMCFYSALHWVEWYAKVQGDELDRQYQNYPSPHDRLLAYVFDIAKNRQYRDLDKAYNDLKNASQISRYLTDIRTNSWLYYSRYKTRDVDKSFENLEIVKRRLNR
ncbi:hypothetical protein IQ269_17420 [Tychonema sp. LEGE 07199]|uniref:hypothetical protein n=1 Tax=unclassified Tychonema TaxID=2642144 RepID=UPI00187F4BBA|nr:MULTISPECIES: hypothetical protein [unclassified Tychonema]MBE9122530.1 hypothetical protein [Tychonema sp. LEGE 07199]MBE9134528.1 hypothetical protein [Tychonema sp. LEGE 07196]